MPSTETRDFSGRAFAGKDIALVRELVETCSGLSRTELAHTVCELLEWRRPNGRLKDRECRELLERWEKEGLVQLPALRVGRPRGLATRVPVSSAGERGSSLVGTVRDFSPVELTLAGRRAEHELFRELLGRYHVLGYRVPFGASLRYLVWVSRPERTVVGVLQFSSPAWRMAVRDQWIGWSDEGRRERLQQVVNNSRFLLLPWVRVRNLASTVLSRAAWRLREDWSDRYGTEPVLLETLVDKSRYRGDSYRAANWLELGETSGRGRMDRGHQRHSEAPKRVFVYPLVRDAVGKLRGAEHGR